MPRKHTAMPVTDNEIVVRDDILYVTLRGPQPKAVAIEALRQFKQRITELKAQRKKVYVYVDLEQLELNDVSTEARVAMKEAFRQPFDALAAVGHNRLLEVATYLIRAGGARSRARYFSSSRKAWRWLHAIQHGTATSSTIGVVAYAVSAIGALGLIGWWLDLPAMTRVVSELRPINPMAALGLVVLGIGLAGVWWRQMKIIAVSAAFIIFLGLFAVLPLGIDHLLFADKVRAAGVPTDLADSAALCFVLAGLSLLLVESMHVLARISRYILSVSIVSMALFNLFGLLYARDALYGLSESFVMPLSLAFAFTICGCLLLAIAVYHYRGRNVISSINRTGWMILIVLLLAQGLTFAAWRQSIARNTTDTKAAFSQRSQDLTKAIQVRVGNYIDALQGFKGLYAASTGISEGEFHAYYDTINLESKYPGLRTVSFISRVPTAGLPALIAERRADTSLLPGGHPSFSIKQQSERPVHYILTYVATTTSDTSLGIDFADTDVRRTTYETAIRTGKPATSQTIQFDATPTAPASRGFFISIPLQNSITAQRSGDNRYVGMVNAVFNYDNFFNSLFAANGGAGLLDEVDLTVTDAQSGNRLYSSDVVKQTTTQHKLTSVQVGNHVWHVWLEAGPRFGTSASQNTLPQSILWGGQAFSVLLIVIFIIQNQARRRAMKLADAITADLQVERNTAISIQQKDDAILSSIGDAVFAIDTNGNITLFNPAAEAISGFSAAEALGKRYSEVLHFEYEKDGGLNSMFVQKALGGSMASMDGNTVLIRKDGSRVAVADSAAPIRDSAGVIMGAIIVFRDVSKEHELDKAKTEFVSLASHQLRTPLSAINWYAEMLMNGDAGKVNDEQLAYVREIYEGSQRMVELVNSLLDVSRLDLGKLSNEPQPNNIAEIVDSMQKELAVTIDQKEMQVIVDVQKHLPTVIADPKLVRMIIQNLLSNAVKYTPPKGSVTLIARKAVASDLLDAQSTITVPCMLLTVTDTGYGIPRDQQGKIFSKLFRADNVRSLDVEGTGLGLYIVKEVVQKLGGKVWFTSMESAGSTFYVLLPFTTARTTLDKTTQPHDTVPPASNTSPAAA